MSYTEINSVKVYEYHACKYNHEINCDDYKRFPERCARCGWNPEEEARRKEVFNHAQKTASASQDD